MTVLSNKSMLGLYLQARGSSARQKRTELPRTDKAVVGSEDISAVQGCYYQSTCM